MFNNKYKFAIITINYYLFVVSLASARLAETESEIETRYGKPVSPYAYLAVDPDYDKNNVLSKEEEERNAELEKRISPESFREDGTRIDFVGEDAMVYADSRLVFYNVENSEWEVLNSNVIGREPKDADSEELKRMTANARKHLRQRFYISNGIGISVVFLGGKSVSETYHQKNVHFEKDFMISLIEKSFPDSALQVKNDERGLLSLVQILQKNTNELSGCATYIDLKFNVSAYPYFNFLKAMELSIQKDSEKQQIKKIDGF